MFLPQRRRLAILATAALFTQSASADMQASLYDRLGGESVVTSIVSDLIDRSSKDPRTQASWRKVNLKRVKQELHTHLCSLTGGPCEYTGDSMKDVHAGLNVTESQMYAVVQMLRDVMTEHGVGIRERNEVLAILAPMKRDVVTR